MALRVCSVPGCPTLVTSGKCPEHRRDADRQRGRRQARGYDAAHDRLRAAWQARIDAGEVIYCWRCTTTRITGRRWHLGHDDHDRSTYRGPECVPCSTATAGRR